MILKSECIIGFSEELLKAVMSGAHSRPDKSVSGGQHPGGIAFSFKVFYLELKHNRFENH